MSAIGTSERPLRVAVIGSGPAGFYVAEALGKRAEPVVEIDMFDRLPTPFGLVRFGVAPDHEKIKTVTRVYEKIASKPGFRFFGNVEFGTHLSLDDLRDHYHQVCFATGAQTDRRLGIPGEDLRRSHPATEFVAWYNGHPDFRDLRFDLSVERVAVVGVGNVAVDVARILCRTTEELATTDIADYALEALRGSRVREVYLLGRRGPAQAAFTNPELKELGELAGAAAAVPPEEAELDDLSRDWLAKNEDRSVRKKVELLQEYSRREATGKPRTLTLRFLVSPVELIGDECGQVANMRMQKNRLFVSDDGSLRPKPTDEFEELPVEMVFRSVGYRGVPLPGVPFHEKWGVVHNEKGRVIDPADGGHVTGLYASGWIKRGPTGVIGTNKPDAVETVACMLEDLERGAVLRPPHPAGDALEQLVRRRQPGFVSYEDWKRLDDLERRRGEGQGRPRVKLTSVEEMLAAVHRESA